MVAADADLSLGWFAESVGLCGAFGVERLVFEAEFGSGVADGGFGVAEVGVGVHAVGGGAKGAGVVVGGDVVAVAVGLDGGDCAFPRGSVGVVVGAGAEDGGDVVRWVDLGGGDELALGPAVALDELLFERAEVADVVGVAVDPGGYGASLRMVASFEVATTTSMSTPLGRVASA